jgi:hypothetical protein
MPRRSRRRTDGGAFGRGPTRAAVVALVGALAVALACPARARAAEGADAVRPPHASLLRSRVTALTRPVRFGLPGGGEPCAWLAAGSSVVVIAPPAPGQPPRLVLETGEVAWMPTGAGFAGGEVRLEGLRGRFQLGRGARAAYWRRASDGREAFRLIEGQASALVGTGVVSLTKAGTYMVATGRSSEPGGPPAEAGRRIDALVGLAAPPPKAPASVPGKPAAGPPPRSGSKAVTLPCAVPPALASAVTCSTTGDGVEVVPFSGGSAAAPIKGSVHAETVSSLRQRLLVGLPENGLGGSAFLLEYHETPTGRVRNVVCAGARSAVRFFFSQDWIVTAAPGTIVAVEGPDPRGVDQSPPKMKLAVGALMISGPPENLPVALSPEHVAAPATETTTGSGPAGERQMLVVAPDLATPPAPREVMLARARELLHPALTLPIAPTRGEAPAPGSEPGSDDPVIVMTLLMRLPEPADNLTKYLPVHFASDRPLALADVWTFGDPPAGPPAERAMGLLLRESVVAGEPLPVALVAPVSLHHDLVVSPAELTLFLTRKAADPFELLAEAQNNASLAGARVTDAGRAPAAGGQRRGDAGTLMLAVVLVILFGIPGVRDRLVGLLDLIPGFGGVRCRRCAMVLDRYGIGEFSLDENQDPLQELVRYDSIGEVIRQEASRTMILERIRSRAPGPARGAPRFRVSATWCQRCLSGAITAEVVHDGRAVDETEWTVTSADTHKLLTLIENPNLPVPPPVARKLG